MSVNNLKTTLNGFVRYKGQEGQLAFILHRLTGLGTLLFLAIHIVDTAFVYFWPVGYGHAIDLYRSTPFMIGEIFIFFAVIYHGVNGLRIAYFDLFKPAGWEIRRERSSVFWTLGITLVLWLPAAYIMGRSMLVHNFGLFGG